MIATTCNGRRRRRTSMRSSLGAVLGSSSESLSPSSSSLLSFCSAGSDFPSPTPCTCGLSSASKFLSLKTGLSNNGINKQIRTACYLLFNLFHKHGFKMISSNMCIILVFFKLPKLTAQIKKTKTTQNQRNKQNILKSNNNKTETTKSNNNKKKS